MRILIYTGKGGVGKTSMAAAAACSLAAKGRRVLIMSTDQAHSLGDSFDIKLGCKPLDIAENLQALEIDTLEETRKSWGSLQEYLKRIMNTRAKESIEADEALTLPTIEELFAMLSILDAYKEGRWDVIILDCAPTGETLSLLRFPERLGQMVKKLMPFVRGFNFTAGFAVSRFTKVARPEDKVLTDFEKLMDRLMQLQKLISDPEICSIRIVTTPERIVLSEAKRNYTWMHMYGFNVDGVIINRIYPDEAMQGYFSNWIQVQKESIEEALSSFPDARVFKMYLKDHEIRGLESLRETADEVYGDTQIDQVFVSENIIEYENTDSCSIMTISLPYAGDNEVSAEQIRDDILIAVGNERRRFPVPEELEKKTLDHFEYKNGLLKVYLT